MAVSLDDLRALALGLPEATEEDHHGLASYRVRGKVFATVPDGGHVRVMVDEAETRALVASAPAIYAEKWWGQRLACVVVALGGVDADDLHDLLAEAWARRAPKRLVVEHLAGRRG